MPNFHDNLLVIAADEQDMRNVVLRFAQNLVANGVELSLAEAEGTTDLEDLWHLLRRWLDADYWYAFAGAPLDAGVEPPDGERRWESPTSSTAGFLGQMGALGARLGGALGDDANVSMSVAPTGRYIGDSAHETTLTRYEQGCVVTVGYATAWEPNYDDLDVFFLGLPQGTYGVAFLDSDEGDWYATASVVGGACDGQEEMPVDRPKGGDFSADDLERMGQERWRQGVKTLGDLAFVVGCRSFCFWMRNEQDMGEEEEAWDYDRDGSFEASYERHDREAAEEGLWPQGESLDEDLFAGLYGGPTVDWEHPSEKDMATVRSLVLQRLGDLPLGMGASGPWGDDDQSAATRAACAAVVERLVPGTPLRVSARWEDGYDWSGVGVTLEVRTVDGALVGYAGSWERNTNEVLALLLPHLVAHVEGVLPLSARNPGTKYPEVTVRLDLAPGSLEGLADEIPPLLTKPLSERGTQSYVEEAM